MPNLSLANVPRELCNLRSAELPWHMAAVGSAKADYRTLCHTLMQGMSSKLGTNGDHRGVLLDVADTSLQAGFGDLTHGKKGALMLDRVQTRVRHQKEGKATVEKNSPLLQEKGLTKKVPATGYRVRTGFHLSRKPTEEQIVHIEGSTVLLEQLQTGDALENLLRETAPELFEPSEQTVHQLLPTLVSRHEWHMAQPEVAEETSIRRELMHLIHLFFHVKFRDRVHHYERGGELQRLMMQNPVEIHDDAGISSFNAFFEQICKKDLKNAQKIIFPLSMFGFAVADNTEPTKSQGGREVSAREFQKAFNGYWPQALEGLGINWARYPEFMLSQMAIETQFTDLPELIKFFGTDAYRS